MDTGFSYGDIIVIGAIAVFILLRYRAMLGETGDRTDNTGPQAKVTPISEFERVIQLPAARITALTEKKDEFASYKTSLAESFVAMRGIDREFTPDEFLQGARAAYEMVIDAFNNADRDTLKMLLSDTIYQQFDASLKEEETSGEKSKTTLTAINNATISAAKLSGNMATITVEFLSEQVHLTYNAAGDIIEGDVSNQQKVEDSWVFTRNLSSTDLNWKIIET